MSKADPHRQVKAPSPPAPPSAPPASDYPVAAPLPPVQPPPTLATKPPAVPPPRTPAVSPMAPYSADAVLTPAAPKAKPAPPAKAAPASKPVPRPMSSSAPASSIAAAGGLAIPVHPAEEQPVDLTEAAMKGAPPFLISMFVHMVLIIVLALVTFSNAIKESLELKAVYAESIGQQLLDDKLQSPEALDMHVDVPVLAFGLNPADDPLAAPPKLPDFFDGASSANSRIDAPNIGFALTGRESGMKKALLPIYGGTASTEGAVTAGLEWLKKQQMRDGGWSLAGPYSDGSSSGDDRCAATAMALLAFQGYGATHVAGVTVPDYHDAVQRGWNFLLKMQDRDGYFQHEGTMTQRAYAQAQATIALCEIYGMTKDSKFKAPAQLALNWAHKAQSTELGGWRYQPKVDSDTSVTGWYVMAFQSGLMAGLEVQSPNLEMVSKFLDTVAVDDGSKYRYQPGRDPTPTMTAEALLCRQYLGWKHDDPRMRAGIEYVLAHPIDYEKDPNVYYWYYATQACHHMDGDDWNRWNSVMRQAIPAAQIKTGADRGSWTSVGDPWASHGGRLYTTCLSIFMLETYYRHLPIYKWRLQ